MKIYVAGKITGLENFKDKFQKAVDILEAEGHTVMNPAILPKGFEHDEYMRVCYSMIDVCEVVLMLDNWKDSKGAMMEFEYAKEHMKTIMFQQSYNVSLKIRECVQ